MTEGGHCGSKPKRIAIGVAPLGTISIGIVPMGVITAGPMSMGLIQIRSTTNPRYLAYPSREEAEEQARQLGCEGVHRMGDRYWMPCNEHPQ